MARKTHRANIEILYLLNTGEIVVNFSLKLETHMFVNKDTKRKYCTSKAFNCDK